MRILMLVLSGLALTGGMWLVSGQAQVHVFGNIFSNQVSSTSAQAGGPSPSQAAPAQTDIRSLDQIVDTDAVAYLEIKDVKTQVETLRLMETLKSFMPLLASGSKLSPEKDAALGTLWSILAPSLQGANVALAGWPGKANAASSGKKKGPEPAVGVFMKFASGDQLRQLMQRREEIEKALEALIGDQSDKSTSDVSFVTLNDTLVIGEPGVLDRVLPPTSPVGKLADDSHYKAARARWADAPIFLYADLDRLVKMVEADEKKSESPATGQKPGEEGPAKEVASLREMINLEQLPKLAASVRFQETHTLIKLLLLERRSGIDPAKGVFALLKPADAGLRAAQWQPSRADASVTLALDWQALYDAVVPPLEKIFFSKEGQGGSPVPMIETLIGYKIRDQLLPALGSISLSFDSLASLMSEPSSAPRLNVLVSVRNREVVEGALKNVARMIPSDAGSNASAAQENGMAITQLGSWGYSFVEGFLALSSDPEALRQMIKDHQSARTLATEPDFVRATQGLPTDLVAWGYASPSAVKQLFESLRQEAIKNEPQLASVLAQFPTPSQPASLGFWKESADLVAEIRVPEGVLPMLIASGIGSKRADDRDRAIQEKAVAALANKPDLSSVEVSVKRGVVTLSGTVKTEAAKALAQQLVEKIEGVKSVTNDIEVEPEQ